MTLLYVNPFIVGIIAGTLTGIALLPQLIKIIREKKANDISIIMLLVLFGGISLWIWYGILKDDWIIIVTNAFSLVINLLIMIFNYVYRKKR
jgi:MtN3 and saliva related transmembrane protein